MKLSVLIVFRIILVVIGSLVVFYTPFLLFNNKMVWISFLTGIVGYPLWVYYAIKTLKQIYQSSKNQVNEKSN